MQVTPGRTRGAGVVHRQYKTMTLRGQEREMITQITMEMAEIDNNRGQGKRCTEELSVFPQVHHYRLVTAGAFMQQPLVTVQGQIAEKMHNTKFRLCQQQLLYHHHTNNLYSFFKKYFFVFVF